LGFLEQIKDKPVTLKVGRAHEVIEGDFPFVKEQATCALGLFFSNPSSQVVHNRHLVLRGKKEKEKRITQIGHYKYCILNLAHAFEQHLEPPHPPKKKKPSNAT
jgi:hypothetical protein